MPTVDIVHVPEKKGFEKAALLSFLFWFALINLLVYVAFDRHFFSYVPSDRLMMNPSENQIHRVLAAIQGEKGIRHIVFLGNSIVWGVGVDNEAETMVGRVKTHFANQPDVHVLSLAVPGESILDSFAALRSEGNPNDIFVLVVNTTFAEDHARYASFEKLVHFPELVEKEFSAERKDIAKITPIAIPPSNFSVLKSFAEKCIPLYGDRDALAGWLIGISFPDAERAVLHRLVAGNVSGAFVRKPMAWERTETVHRPLPPLDGSWTLQLLSKLFSENGRASNVITVLIDDDRYDHGKETLYNATLLRRALSGGTLIDLYGKLNGKFYDTLHLTSEGHGIVAKALFPLLDNKIHAP